MSTMNEWMIVWDPSLLPVWMGTIPCHIIRSLCVRVVLSRDSNLWNKLPFVCATTKFVRVVWLWIFKMIQCHIKTMSGGPAYLPVLHQIISTIARLLVSIPGLDQDPGRSNWGRVASCISAGFTVMFRFISYTRGCTLGVFEFKPPSNESVALIIT